MSITLPIVVAAILLAQPAPNQPSAHPPETPARAPTAPTFEERLKQVDAKMGAVQDLRADFEQRKKTPLLKRPLVSKGSLLSKRGDVLWTTTEPRKTKMLVTDKHVKIYYPDDKLVEVYPIDARFREAAGGPLPRLSRLRDRFEITELNPKELSESAATEGLVAFKLTPKAEDLRRHLSFVRVLIDERIPCANRIIITDPDGDETELRFSNVKINTGVKDTEIELELPKDVRVSSPMGDTPPDAGGPSQRKPPTDETKQK